jgi:hypothetical protein
VAVAITDPEHRRDALTVSFGDDEGSHWIAIDATHKRVVLSWAGSNGDRLFIVNFDPATGKLAIDDGSATREVPRRACRCAARRGRMGSPASRLRMGACSR